MFNDDIYSWIFERDYIYFSYFDQYNFSAIEVYDCSLMDC